MAFDGIVLRAVALELKEKLYLGKIEKVYEPEMNELVFLVHTKNGNYRLYSSSNPNHARIHIMEGSLVNPPEPLTFCMVLRKHVQGARITDIKQIGSERILEIEFESLNELGFSVSKKLVFEIMGRHSNVVLVDLETGKIIDAIKHVGFSESRVRQILPGMTYVYPPLQEKVPFDEVNEVDLEGIEDPKALLSKVGGISPVFSEEAMAEGNPLSFIKGKIADIESGRASGRVYLHEDKPVDFYAVELPNYEKNFVVKVYDTVSEAIEEYFRNKETANQGKQKASDLIKQVNTLLSKYYLKKKRLSEDLMKAENSEDLRLYGELLMANLYRIEPGMSKITLQNYYDGTEVTIPLDKKLNGNRNAQAYFKKYGKQKTAVKEKQIQLDENENDIVYLESVLSFLENTDNVLEIASLKEELVENGYIRYRKVSGFKEKKAKMDPVKYTLSNGMIMLVGRNNKENDHLTFKLADKTDLWLHTKDIPGSHALIKTNGIDITGIYREEEMDEKVVMEAAAIAAYHSKGRNGENIPVDIVPIRYVKKPNGAKPGMVIFTNNRTVYVNPLKK